jgi:DNA-binding NtrC family response regulator
MTKRGRVLVVDDKASMLSMLERILKDRCDVATASDGVAALKKLDEESYDVVLSDIRMPGKGGLEVLATVRQSHPGVEVILMTAFGTVQSAVEAMQRGAFDYITKPFEPDEALVRVLRAVEHKQLRERATALAEVVDDKSGFERLKGKSAAMRRVFALLEKAAGLELTVLITGPSGTGKELAARALHTRSRRSEAPFVAVNCGAIPAELLESELFGHKKGAFTGASEDKAGLIEEASKGTLFLDEIGDMPLPLQVKLNRALQEREYRRVGDTKDKRVDARILAATNVDLKQRVAAGKFREDLLYRLRVFEVAMPSLAERSEDIPVLAEHFRARAVARAGSGPTGFAQAAMRALMSYAWPGNVRELENAIERAVAVAEREAVAAMDLPPEVAEAAGLVGAAKLELAELGYREAMELVRERGTRDYLVALMTSFGGNVSRAAERAGIARESLHRLLKRHDVEPEAFRPRGA